ncbi:MAG: 3-deoxy-D-manno-octulosonic acid transferase [Cyclobacteriaceae bacterium]|nr:3-deoxy-D-manno-octulosonic acid transferase [Cyclobacteriaceae bacterium]
MRTLLYNVSILLLKGILPLLARLSAKANLFYQGRKNLFSTIELELRGNSNPLFWVHCSSVGEFEQGLPVIELLKEKQPTWKVVVTFFSPSGYEAVNHPIIDYKFYLPIDTKSNATQFINLIQPKVALFIKYEFWYHFLKELNAKQVPTYSVSSIFRPSQTFFKWYGGWNRKMLRRFNHFMVQDQVSLKLLNSIGINNASLTGDTRFDRVIKLKQQGATFPEIDSFIRGKKVFIIGSLRPEDDGIIFPFVNANPEFAYIIAPHDITEKYILKIEQSISSTIRHSMLQEHSNKKVLIIDSIGKLSRLYQLADFAYVGGGFSDGIHNILEPAVYNIPIFFGNQHYKKYKEAVDLVRLEAAFPVQNSSSLETLVNKFANPTVLKNVSKKMEEYVKSNEGAARKVVSLINEQNAS